MRIDILNYLRIVIATSGKKNKYNAMKLKNYLPNIIKLFILCLTSSSFVLVLIHSFTSISLIFILKNKLVLDLINKKNC